MLRAISVASVTLVLALALAPPPAPALTVSAPYLVEEITSTHMTAVGDTLFLATGGKENVLWKSDGTAAGTVSVAELPGPTFEDPTAFGDLLVFQGPGGLWTSDGTESGTRLIAAVAPSGEDRYESPPMVVRGGTLFVQGCGPAGCGLWRSDGTSQGTLFVKGGVGSEIAPFRSGVIGSNGWLSDGTAEGTQRFGPGGLNTVRVVGDDLVLFTRSTRYGRNREYTQLWRTDGTDDGTFPIATVQERFIYDEDFYDGYVFPAVLPSAADDGRFVACAGDGMWSSDGTAHGTRFLARASCGPNAVKHKVGNVWLFSGGGSLWRSDGTPGGTYRLASMGGVQVLGGTKDIVLFTVRGDDRRAELWQSDGTTAGTFAVAPMPTLGWTENDDEENRPVRAAAGDTVFFCGCPGPYSSFKWCEADSGCGLWAVTISGSGTTTTSTSTTSTTLPPLDPPVGTVLADVSVLKKKSRSVFGHKELLWLDHRSPKQTFIRMQVVGLGDQPAGAATLRLRVADTRDAPSKAAGRVHLMDDCSWDEDTTTWKNQPAFEGEKPLHTPSGPVIRGQTVEFDVTDAIVGDGVYCFALDSESADGVEYYSREADAHQPELLVSRPDADVAPADPLGVTVSAPYLVLDVPGKLAQMTADGDTLLFVTERPWLLWKSDGTAAGTVGVDSVDSDLEFSHPREPLIAGGLSLSVSCGTHGEPCQLWRTDGTNEGTFPIADLISRFNEEAHDQDLYPMVLPSTAGDGSFLVCTTVGLWTSDGTAEGTRLAEEVEILRSGCDPDTVKLKVGGEWTFQARGSLWRSDGTPEGTRSLGPFAGGGLQWVLGHTNEVVVFSVETEDGGTELWQSDGTAAGTFAVSPMPSVGTADAYHDDDEERAVVGTAGNTVFFSGCVPDLGCNLWAIAISGQTTTAGDHPVGHIVADVSVLKKESRRPFGREDQLWVDRKSAKHTFIRAQVTGLGEEPAGAATLRLHVADTRDAASRAAGRIHLMDDCRWDEDTTTWKNRPAFEGEEPLGTPSGPVVRGQTVDFDVTDAIVGDGVYCFALDSESSDGVEYYSREADAGGPELLVSRPDPAAGVGVIVADASVRETEPDRNYGTSTVLRVDGKSVKRTFFRVRVFGFDAEAVRDVWLRLHVDDKRSARGIAGRLYETADCAWDELAVTYETQPVMYGPPSTSSGT